MEVYQAEFTTAFVFAIHLLGVAVAGGAIRSLFRLRHYGPQMIALCIAVGILCIPVIVSLVALVILGRPEWARWLTQWFL